MKILKKSIYILFILSLMLIISLTVSGADADETRELLSDSKGRVVAVSHRGDTASYPANSLEAVISAKEKGADAVSVAVNKTKDGEFVLVEDVPLANVCDTAYSSLSEITSDEIKSCALYDSFGNKTEYKAVSVEDALTELDGRVYLILDINWEDRDEIYAIIEKLDAFSAVSLRVQQSASKIAEWIHGDIDVIGVYGGNIIWNSIGHINKLSEKGMLMAEYRTKNYFNVCYGTLVGDNFSSDGKARAIAAAYDINLCGKRSDSAEGWKELIDNGFSVIETNNIQALAAYIERLEKAEQSLNELVKKAEKEDFQKYSSVSRQNIADSIKNAKAVLDGRAVSLEKAENAYSSLVFSLNEKRVADSLEETEGALNITAGKILTVLLIGAAILGGQVFVYKKHKKKA